MSRAIRVRDARPADFRRIAELTVRAYRGMVGDRYLAELADVPSRAAHTQLLVADAPPEAVPLGAVAFIPQGGRYAEVAQDGEATFRMLAVDPAAQGRGVGAALVGECLRRARAAAARRLVLSTDPRMVPAHRIYDRFGFVRDTTRDWCPEPGVRLLCYVLDCREAP